MGMVLEFFALDPALVPDGQADLAFARAHGMQVADVSINSAALPEVQAFLVRTALAPIFTRPEGTAAGVFFASQALAPLLRHFPQGGPDGMVGIEAALEDAVEEAGWRGQGLWIGAA